MKQIEKGLQIVCAWVALHGTQTFAQDLFYQWGLGFADMNYVEQGGELDAAGNLITFSCYNGTHDMDPTAGGDVITPAGSYDFFLAKYDPDGLLLWSHGFGAPPNEIVGDVTTDSDLNIYITGHIQGGPVDFNPAFPGTTVLSSSGLFDSFIAKYNPDGELIWIKIIGNPTSNDKALFIDIDDNLNVYISGLFMGTTDFDPSLSNTSLSSTPGFNDVFVAKYDTSGNFVWVKQITGSEYYELNAMTIDNNNDLIVSTIYTTSSDFNPSGGGDVHTVPTDYAPTSLTKFGSDGTYLWTKDLSGNALTAWLDINDMKTDAANNIIIGAYYENNPDFDPSAGVAIFPSIPASGCFCFAKYDANGNYTYAKTFGYGSVTSLDLDAAGNIYLAGVYSLTVDFDPSTGTQSKTSNGLADLFLAKYSSVGNYEWVYTNGGTAQDVLMDVEVSPGGSIRVVGHNENPAVDFDPSPAIQTLTMETTGTIASFWARYDQCLATTATDVQTACGSYTWINGTTYTASNNTATHVLTNAEGCDSIITLNLTINPVLASSQTLSICSGESVTVGTSTYSTSGVYTDVLTAVNGCDSTVTTDLTVGAAISGSQTLSICSGESVTVGTNTYTVSGVYTDVLTAVNGCDSTVTTDLTVHAVIDVSTTVSGITITANAAPASYQWVDCTNGFLPVSGEINQSYVANVNGNYAVIVTQNGCADTSICVSITMNGLGEWSQNHQLLVYPNPATGVVMIQADGIMNQVEVMNSMGEVVMRETAGEKQLQLDLGNLSPGIYYLLVSTDNERTVRKIVKK